MCEIRRVLASGCVRGATATPIDALLQYPAGESVLDVLGNLSNAAAVDAFVEGALICLERLHKAGVVHRDVKPHNFILWCVPPLWTFGPALVLLSGAVWCFFSGVRVSRKPGQATSNPSLRLLLEVHAYRSSTDRL